MYLAAGTIQLVCQKQAVRFADTHMGVAHTWPAHVINYQHTSDFQKYLRAERGHWLITAAKYGKNSCRCPRQPVYHDYFSCLCRSIANARKLPSTPSNRSVFDGNDDRYKKFFETLAPAMVTHYLIGTGWSSPKWECRPIPNCHFDVDFSAISPTGCTGANFQIKAPDRPGHTVNGQVVDGENDNWVIAAIEKGADQLPRTALQPGFVVASPNRHWPISSMPVNIESFLLGGTCSNGGGAALRFCHRGVYWKSDWAHVSGVILLDFVGSVASAPGYLCTVLLNPAAHHPAQPDWFPYAHVLELNGQRFRWIRGRPAGESSFRDGTWLEL